MDTAGDRLLATGLAGRFLPGNVTITPPTGMAERAEVAAGTGTTKTVGEASDAKQASVGASGNKTATASRSAPAVAQLVVLRPAS
jgi:hypothetical protein